MSRIPIAVCVSLVSLCACGPSGGGGTEGEGEEGEGEEGEGEEGEGEEGEGEEGEGEGEGEGELCNGCCFDAAEDCAASEVCRYQADEDPADPGECTDADGIEYIISVGSVTMCETDPDGAEWDVGAGAPDPLIEIVVNGVAAATSVAEQDSYTPFDEPFVALIELSSTDSVSIIIYDEDLTENDFAGGVCVGAECDGPVGIDNLREYFQALTFDCNDAGVGVEAMTVLVFPNFN